MGRPGVSGSGLPTAFGTRGEAASLASKYLLDFGKRLLSAPLLQVGPQLQVLHNSLTSINPLGHPGQNAEAGILAEVVKRAANDRTEAHYPLQTLLKRCHEIGSYEVPLFHLAHIPVCVALPIGRGTEVRKSSWAAEPTCTGGAPE